MKNEIINGIDARLNTFNKFKIECSNSIFEIASLLIDVFNQGGSLLIAGNGGSAADAQHLAAELIGKYYSVKKPLPVQALTTNSSVITALGNDLGIENIFDRQVQAFLKEGDALMLISTSGNSENILRAAEQAKSINAKIIALTGKSGGALKKIADVCLSIPSDDVPLIQECHIIAEHIICELVEKYAK